MRREHVVLAVAFLGGLGGMLSAVDGWSAIQEPAFVGGLLTMTGAAIAAAFLRPPGEP